MVTLQINQAAASPLVLQPAQVSPDEWKNAAQDVADVLRRGIERDGGDLRLFEKLVRKSIALTALLLTDDQQRQLKTLSAGTSLTVSASLSEQQIPWELLRIGDEFLCERLAVGRIVSDSAANTRMSDGTQQRSTAAVLVADALELVSANTERTIVERRLRQLSHDFPALLQIAATEHGPLEKSVFRRQLEECRWLHFAGHATEVAGQRVLNLHEPTDRSAAAVAAQWTPADMCGLSCAPEVVFLNACGALQFSGDEDGIDRTSLVSEFLRLGTKWLLGAVVPVLDSQTRHFTTEFYDSVLRGCSMGEAVRQARLQARRKLKANNLLPLSYALYGDPSTTPFPLKSNLVTCNSDAMISLAGPWDEDSSFMPGGLAGRDSLSGGMALPLRSTVSALTFPCTCDQCRRTIETRHGLGNETGVSLGDPAICSECQRQGAERLSQEPDVPRDGSAAALWTQPLESSIDTHISRCASASVDSVTQPLMTPHADFLRFQRHLQECLSRVCEWNDLRTGIRQSCVFRAQQAGPSGDCRDGLASLDADMRKQPSLWSASYSVVSQTGRKLAELQVLVPESVAAPDSQPLTTATLLQALADCDGRNRNAASSAVPRLVFVCSLSGIQSSLSEELTADADPLWYTTGRTIYLHDVSRGTTHFRSTDLTACCLLHLLQRESTGRQFQLAERWICGQLPLVTSLSRDELVRHLNIETDAAEAAMRYVGIQQGLHLDETAEFGMVLSERDPACSRLPDAPVAHCPSIPEKVLAAVLWPFRGIKGSRNS